MNGAKHIFPTQFLQISYPDVSRFLYCPSVSAIMNLPLERNTTTHSSTTTERSKEHRLSPYPGIWKTRIIRNYKTSRYNLYKLDWLKQAYHALK